MPRVYSKMQQPSSLPALIPSISYWCWPGESVTKVADPPAVYPSFMPDADIGSIMGGSSKAGRNLLDWLGIAVPIVGWELSSTLCRPQRVVLILSRRDSSRLMFVVIKLAQG